MKRVNENIISATGNQTTNSAAIDANQLFSASFAASFSTSQAAGTLKLQASNDPTPEGYTALQANFAPTNWIDIPNQSANVTSGSSALLTIVQSAYRWLRAVYTSTATGTETIQPIADTGVKQVQTVASVADTAGSLNSTYFLVSSVNLVSKVQKNFYVWFDNGAGVDPLVPGKTGVQVTYTNGDTSAAVAIAARAALNALTNDFVVTGATNQIIITNKAYGRVTAAADGTAATGFGFTDTTPGVTSNLTGKYFKLYASGSPASASYYVWMNVDSIGTDPAPAGLTAVPVVFSSGATAGTIGAAIASAIDALADISATGTTTVTVTLTSGPFTPASDFNTGFTIAVTGGGASSTVTVNMFSLSV